MHHEPLPPCREAETRPPSQYLPHRDGPVDPRDRRTLSGRRRHAAHWKRLRWVTPWPTRAWAAVLAAAFAALCYHRGWSWSVAAATGAAAAVVLFAGHRVGMWRRQMGPLPLAEEVGVAVLGALVGAGVVWSGSARAVLLAPLVVLALWAVWGLFLLRVPAPFTQAQWSSMRTWAESVRRHPEEGPVARAFGRSPLWVWVDPVYRAERAARAGQAAGTALERRSQ